MREKIVKSLSEFVGWTPLFEPVNLEKKYQLKSRLLIKLEYVNPAGSVKDRAALAMIERAEREGKLHPGDTIVEQTSGNTGIALAAYAAAKGYKLIIFFENGSSMERKQILEAYGAKVFMYTDLLPLKQMLEKGVIDLKRIVKSVGDYAKAHGYYFINQLENPENPAIHYRTTGPEIWSQSEGRVDAFVAMAGTGGTLNGVGRYLREVNPEIRIFAAQPSADSRIGAPGDSKDVIDGVGAFSGVPKESVSGFVSCGVYDEVLEVSAQEAFATANQIIKTDGLFLGTSSGAAICAALHVAQLAEFAGKTIVTIAPDDGMKYLSTKLYRKS